MVDSQTTQGVRLPPLKVGASVTIINDTDQPVLIEPGWFPTETTITWHHQDGDPDPRLGRRSAMEGYLEMTEKPTDHTTVYVVVANTGYMETRDQWIVGVYFSEHEAQRAARGIDGTVEDLSVQVLHIVSGQQGHYAV